MARSARSTSGRGASSRKASRGRIPSLPTPAINPGARIWFVFIVFIFLSFVLVGRAAWLSVIDASSNREDARNSRLATIDLPARRGTIYDRNGTVLATSINAVTVVCNPVEVTDPQGEAAQLAAVLGGKPSDYLPALTTPDTVFAYVARKISEADGDKLKALDMPGIDFMNDSMRVYPNGRVAGQIIGMCDIDDIGLSGLEMYYNDILAGTNGQIKVERGQNGFPIAGGVYANTAAQNGQDIVVSLDLEMQEYLESRLTEEIQRVEGKSGNALIYDGATGEILAIASTPYLNPSDREHIEEGATELKSISTAFEPGSIFKTASAAAILEADVMSPSETIYCPAVLPADEYVITDAHERDDEIMSLRQIIARSSNIGISLASEKLGFGPLYEAIQRYGLTEATGVDFPGESAGFSTKPEDWSLIQSYNVTFGQGISVTPLQVSRFYGAIANGGEAFTPHFLMSLPQSDKQQEWQSSTIIQNKNAIEPLTSMLQSVVAEGTGTEAQIEGFKPAGKTGTAEFVDESGKYSTDSYNISFVGWLPDTDSKLVCFVGVTDVPADRTTTPAFRDIMSFAINHYRIGVNQG